MARYGRILLAAALVLLAGRVHAFTCSVSTTSLKFSGYDVFSPTATESTGSVNVNCSNPTGQPVPVSIAINSGSSGTFYPRQLKAATGGDALGYYLFTDPSRTVVWGDGTGGTSTVTNVITRAGRWSATIFGSIPPRQNAGAGSYSDSLVVTVLW